MLGGDNILNFRQAKWSEPTLKEMSVKGRSGFIPARDRRIPETKPEEIIPKNMLRGEVPLPELSQLQVLRHFNRLSQMNFSVELGMYPLGSCTMKYNPKVSEYIALHRGIRNAHPLQHESTMQGLLSILFDLEHMLNEITGMSRFSLAPAAGAHGEFAGVLMIKKYLSEKGYCNKDEILIPDSAHGTNPASASMAGFRVVKVRSDERGMIKANEVEKMITNRTAGMMFTVPNTLGLFESEVVEISNKVHDAGGLMYYDGANMNALLGKVRPAELGFDICHLNLHKTFGTPHGGGGPGAGPVGAKGELANYLPVPLIEKRETGYMLDFSREKSIGMIKGFLGNPAVLLRAYCYIRLMGKEGLNDVSTLAVLAANYLWKLLNQNAYLTKHGKDIWRKHEVVVSVNFEGQGAAMKIAKGILDKGYHSPTTYFPLIVEEALMIEPTESEPVEVIEEYAKILNNLFEELQNGLQGVPKNTSVGKIDEAKASHPLTLKLRW
jgi:glycine dehydrogenase subunit 2